MTTIEQREAVCRQCPERETSELYRWCRAKDDWHTERSNCAKSKHGRCSSRLTMPPSSCERWEETPCIYLPDVPTVVYTADKPHLVARHPRVTRLMERLDFSDWRFHWGPAGEPYWHAMRADYCRLLRENAPPFLILEDDIGLAKFSPWIAPPPGAQLVYLGGGGSWPTSRLVDQARAMLPDRNIRRVRHIGLEDIDGFPEWARCYGMFGTHACLWLDKAMMIEAADAIEADSVQTDVILGKNQWRWQCVVRKAPMFYQNDGHNDAGTLDYTTPIPPVTREQRRREALAARGR